MRRPDSPQRYQVRRLPASSPGMPELRVGMAVFDPGLEMPGYVDALYGGVVRVIRPSGLTWEARRISVRPATEWEERQLRALAWLLRKQLPLSGGRT